MIYKDLLKNDYGDKVSIEYIDVQDTARLGQFPVIKSVLETTPLAALPLVAIEGESVWSGNILYPNLVNEIKKRGSTPK